MSIKAINWALETELPPAQKLVLVVIADYADDLGYAFPGVATIARRASISERTLTRVLAELEEGGFLVRERRHLPNGNRTSNGYRLTPEVTSRQIGVLTSRQIGGDKPPTVAAIQEPPVEPPVTTTARARATRFPDGFLWSGSHVEKASARGVNVEVEFEKFKDYHLAKGSTFADWSRAFHTWLNNARPEPVRQGPVTRAPREREIEDLLSGSLGLDQKGLTA